MPFVIDGKCSVCPQEKPVYDIHHKTCIACEDGLVYSDTERTCTKICCTNGKYYNWMEEKCICPKAQPYLDDQDRCVTCIVPKVWNN